MIIKNPIKYSLIDIFFFISMISSPFLLILVTFFYIGTVKVMNFLVFSLKKVNCFFKFFYELFYDKMIIIV